MAIDIARLNKGGSFTQSELLAAFQNDQEILSGTGPLDLLEEGSWAFIINADAASDVVIETADGSAYTLAADRHDFQHVPIRHPGGFKIVSGTLNMMLIARIWARR